jgi:Flp pilus assembly protein CpaB
LQDVLVLAAGQTVEMRDNKPVAVTTVTLSLTPAQIERLALAQVEGKLFLGTRNLSDKRLVETSGATREALLNAAPSPSPGPGHGSAVSRPAVTHHRMTVVRAEKVTEQVFVRAGAGWIEQTEATK